MIEFESGGQKYQTLTRSGVTVMFTQLRDCIHTYGVVQVSVVNGSKAPYAIRPENFVFERGEGVKTQAMNANDMVQLLLDKARRSDALALVRAYEAALFGSPNVHSTNGYEQRREAALLYGPVKIRAAGAASAIALGQTKLAPGESTDGAIFFPTQCKPLTSGRMFVRTNTDIFQFNPQ